MTLGYVALVLHAHLPFIRHPERPDRLEERWLQEAVAECYLPLLDALKRLRRDRIPFRLTLSISPTLMAMLDDPLLRDRCQQYLEASLELAEREVAYTQGRPEETVVQFYRTMHQRNLDLYLNQYGRDLLTGFHDLARSGYLELITCGATHGFLPLLHHQPESVRAQVHVAAQEFRRRFGHSPRGFWLPECGYFPGLDRFLRNEGIQYTLIETHAMTDARPSAPRGPYSHGWTGAGLAVFGRDAPSSKQVWSAQEGYPGDSAYREFYRDIGFERDPAHLGGLAGPNGIRTFSGFKYHRVTGPTEMKDWYDRWAAEQTAIRHAGHFVQERVRQAADLRGLLPGDPPPLIVAPYDAELFGHWWFEGPFFLAQVARHAAARGEIRFVTPGEYLDMYPAGQGFLEPEYSSWGYQGYADFWCDGSNHWVYRHLHGAAGRMVRAAERYRVGADGWTRRVLSQAGRELLLAQASDWAFIMRTGTADQYARHRQQAHLSRFHRMIEEPEAVDRSWLEAVEAADNLFPDLDYRIFVPHE